MQDAAEEEALEALLREVEYAQATLAPTGELVTEPVGLEFPTALVTETSRLGSDLEAPEGAVTTVEPDPDHRVEAPEEASSQPVAAPSGGWAVQVAAYPYANEADAKVDALRAEGLEAYRMAALVDGMTWYRVRIGGYGTEEEAVTARNELRVRLGQPELLIASAP